MPPSERPPSAASAPPDPPDPDVAPPLPADPELEPPAVPTPSEVPDAPPLMPVVAKPPLPPEPVATPVAPRLLAESSSPTVQLSVTARPKAPNRATPSRTSPCGRNAQTVRMIVAPQGGRPGLRVRPRVKPCRNRFRDPNEIASTVHIDTDPALRSIRCWSNPSRKARMACTAEARLLRQRANRVPAADHNVRSARPIRRAVEAIGRHVAELQTQAEIAGVVAVVI